jgi:hypothetical protein
MKPAGVEKTRDKNKYRQKGREKGKAIRNQTEGRKKAIKNWNTKIKGEKGKKINRKRQ